MKSMIKHTRKLLLDKDFTLDDIFVSIITVGERGLFVLPMDARKELDVKPGDNLMVLKHPSNIGVIYTKLNKVPIVAQLLDDDIEAIQKKINQSESEAPE